MTTKFIVNTLGNMNVSFTIINDNGNFFPLKKNLNTYIRSKGWCYSIMLMILLKTQCFGLLTRKIQIKLQSENFLTSKYCNT
jgi:hypothetical protein